MPYYTNATKEYLDKVLEEIKKSIYKPISKLEVTAWVSSEPLTFEQRFSGAKKELSVGQSWGNLFDCAWFDFKGNMPNQAIGDNIVLIIDISGEACVVDEYGTPLQGLTTVASEFFRLFGNPDKRVVILNKDIVNSGVIDVWADAGCNDLLGHYKDSGILKEAHIAVCNSEMKDLYYDFEVLNDLMKSLPQHKARHSSILFTLNEASKCLNKYNKEEATLARSILSKELNKKCGDASLTISAIGHAHIDLAWLWPIRETIRKGARTFSTVLKNMELYPDYIFGASQPQLYQWIKDYYPTLYGKVKERIKEGRWEAQGAMWVEADTNLSGGEALIRQVLYGKTFFREEFDKDMKILWIPDVFGYSAALPQILKKSGVDYFVTIKLGWNKFNKHPHHTFWWQGLDGSRVLTHMPPEGDYTSPANPWAILETEKQFLDKGVSEDCLMLFGIGDGGGGPGEEHLERLKREKDLNGMVPVVQQPALEFFKKIEHESHRYKTWCGELYLEMHQGTYTTQAKSKRFNRKIEIALRELELTSVQAMVWYGKSYPQKEINKIWKEVLLYQFHDILPGSSITRVYDESHQRYEVLLNRVNELINEAYEIEIDHKENDNVIGAVNTLSWKRTEWVLFKEKWIKVNILPLGRTLINMEDSIDEVALVEDNVEILENDMIKIFFHEDGSIKSIIDQEANQEIVLPGQYANRLMVYEDNGDAWDFPINYDEKPAEMFEIIGINQYAKGPIVSRKSLFTYGQSSLEQEIILRQGSKRIDFVTKVDWKATKRMLRTSFPLNLRTDEASCEIQFGNIKRPTHRNTSFDMAKFEVCAHKWVDMSQHNYGVALLNDSKYGHKVIDSTIDLNLLRSTTHPDPVADIGVQEFIYSLYPHKGNYVEGGVVRAAYELNMPIKIFSIPQGHISGTNFDKEFICVDSESVIIETVKKAEKNNDIIVRLYECHGTNVVTKIKIAFPFKSIDLNNMMEEHTHDFNFNKHKMEITLSPFEICTLRILLEDKKC